MLRWSTRRKAHLYALGLCLLSLMVFWRVLTSLANLAFHDERSSHVLFIPLISGFLIFFERRRIFCVSRFCPRIGVALLLITAALWSTLKTPLSGLNNIDRLSGVASVVILVWIAGFILCYGMESFKAALFPLLFLLLMIPIPVAVGDNIASILQRGSAATCYVLFRLIGVPCLREGFRFSLPGADVEVAQNCSGIHSTLALFIVGLLIQHVVLTGLWRKALFVLCIFPIAIFKNAVRIVAISWLGIHVNPGFFYGQLHRQGGLSFSTLSMALLGTLVWLLRRPLPGFARFFAMPELALREKR